jgi:TIR domain
MAKTYNSPPNWPRPPEGWMPEPGWDPDPSWGPAPAGWQFWVEVPDASGVSQMATPSTAGEHRLRVFLSYRRNDCQPQANGLYDGLKNRLPDARVFMDIDGIPAGADFEEYICREISVCDVVLVMIGDNWLDARPGSDVRRIDEPGDFVRLEIESALASAHVKTVPVLVEGTLMPGPDQLPESISRLGRLQAVELDDRRWRGDLEHLVAEVENVAREHGKLAARRPTPAVATPAPEPAPVLLADPGHAGREQAASVVQASPMPGALVWMPLYTVGLGAGVPAFWAAWKRAPGDPVRMRLFLVSGALLVAGAAGFIAVNAAPEDATGSPTGPLTGIGAFLTIVTIIAGILIAKAYRTPPPRS